jgi:hypothetical protein
MELRDNSVSDATGEHSETRKKDDHIKSTIHDTNTRNPVQNVTH